MILQLCLQLHTEITMHYQRLRFRQTLFHHSPLQLIHLIITNIHSTNMIRKPVNHIIQCLFTQHPITFNTNLLLKIHYCIQEILQINDIPKIITIC